MPKENSAVFSRRQNNSHESLRSWKRVHDTQPWNKEIKKSLINSWFLAANRNASCAKASTRFRRGGLRDDSGSDSAAFEREIASSICLQQRSCSWNSARIRWREQWGSSERFSLLSEHVAKQSRRGFCCRHAWSVRGRRAVGKFVSNTRSRCMPTAIYLVGRAQFRLLITFLPSPVYAPRFRKVRNLHSPVCHSRSGGELLEFKERDSVAELWLPVSCLTVLALKMVLTERCRV